MTREEILPIAKPILFNTDMVRAILDDRKTETRRLIKSPYYVDGNEEDPRTLQVLRIAPKGSQLYREIGEMPYPRDPYRIGDYLYVRETWKLAEAKIFHCQTPTPRIPEIVYGYEYKADNGYLWKDGFSIDDVYRVEISSYQQWDPSIHMPKEAARIFLRVTDVRFERLQDMETPNDENYIAEGAKDKHDFIRIWNDTVGLDKREMYGWYANPWVWVIEFERVEVQ